MDPGFRRDDGPGGACCAVSGTPSLPEMRHHLLGEAREVAPRQPIVERAELEEGHQDAEAGAVLHLLELLPHRARAADERRAARDEVLRRVPRPAAERA